MTQATIASTICLAGWTETVRPPESYTDRLKVEQMAAYGDIGAVGGYEEDHLIPLELGGSPDSAKNLWPEPGSTPNPKDQVENAARRAVCDGAMTLAAAQQAIAANWLVLGQQLGAISPATTTPPATTIPATTVPPVTPAPAATAPPTTASGVTNYRAGQFCAQDKIGTIVQTTNGPLICKVTTDPSHPRWEHT